MSMACFCGPRTDASREQVESVAAHLSSILSDVFFFFFFFVGGGGGWCGCGCGGTCFWLGF